MDVLRISSYTNQEKEFIFAKHLLPKAIEEVGLTDYKTSFTVNDEILPRMIDQYCREAGVRSLGRYTKKLVDKIAFKIVTKIDAKEIIDPITIDLSNLKLYLGNPIFEEENLYSNDEIPAGVVTGLAYTQYGGSVLYLESRRRSFGRQNPSPSLKVTGSLGDVMKESMSIAYTYARTY